MTKAVYDPTLDLFQRNTGYEKWHYWGKWRNQNMEYRLGETIMSI